jgi:PPOX class probable F420-dependent enzyme
MRLDGEESRRRFAAARVARLATAGADGVPHLVPVTFVVDGEEIFFAVDHKPKSTTDLRRLRNIEANPAVSFLADEYDEDWTRLWWVRADGRARLLDAEERPVRLLREKYAQYREHPPAGVVVATAVTAWHGWSGAPKDS